MFNESFQSFQYNFVPRVRNVETNALENEFARMFPLKSDFFIEIIYKQYGPNNVTNLHVFNDDQNILHFRANVDILTYDSIDEDKNE